MANKTKITHVSISIHVGFEDETGKALSANESVSLNFQDENELNRVLQEKPHIAEVAPILIKKIMDSHDAQAKAAKKFLSSLT